MVPTGAAAGDCSARSPCALGYALSSQPAHDYILLETGTYALEAKLTISGKQVLVGDGAPRPKITRPGGGTILDIASASDVQIDGLEISGAANNNAENGTAIACLDTSAAGAAMLRLNDDAITHNVDGVNARTCKIAVSRTSFETNVTGADVVDLGGTFDRCTFTSNTSAGIFQDDTEVTVTNSFFYRNQNGLYVTSSDVKPASTYAFNTFVDNQVGIDCQAPATAPVTFSNNIIARNTTNIADGQAPQYSCTFPGSIIADDIAALHFVQPDVAPYDYHLGPGSVAIDAAQAATLDHDFDGEARPKGKGRDVGADEAQ